MCLCSRTWSYNIHAVAFFFFSLQVYVYVSLTLCIFFVCVDQACLPLIDDLSNPAMRTRHWKQLVRVTGGAFTIDNDTLKRMTLKELLSLGLQSKSGGKERNGGEKVWGRVRGQRNGGESEK